jgi:hypothetical protein
LRQCEDRHIVKQIIGCDYDGVKIDVEIQKKQLQRKNELGVQCLAVRHKANNSMQILYAICLVVCTIMVVYITKMY